MALNKLTLETDGLVVGGTQLVASGGGITIGNNLVVNGTAYAGNLVVASNFTTPNWTTATRPVAPTTGQMGLNLTTGNMEFYLNGWNIVSASGTRSEERRVGKECRL